MSMSMNSEFSEFLRKQFCATLSALASKGYYLKPEPYTLDTKAYNLPSKVTRHAHRVPGVN